MAFLLVLLIVLFIFSAITLSDAFWIIVFVCVFVLAFRLVKGGGSR